MLGLRSVYAAASRPRAFGGSPRPPDRARASRCDPPVHVPRADAAPRAAAQPARSLGRAVAWHGERTRFRGSLSAVDQKRPDTPSDSIRGNPSTFGAPSSLKPLSAITAMTDFKCRERESNPYGSRSKSPSELPGAAWSGLVRPVEVDAKWTRPAPVWGSLGGRGPSGEVTVAQPRVLSHSHCSQSRKVANRHSRLTPGEGRSAGRPSPPQSECRERRVDRQELRRLQKA